MGGPDHHGRAVGEVGQQARGPLEHQLDLAVGVVEELPDLLASAGIERPGPGQVVDEEAIALVGGDAPGTGVGLGQKPVTFEGGHVRAHRGRGHAHTGRRPTTCWDPTGWAEPMYSVTTALRMAALRASSSLRGGALVWFGLSSVVGMGVTRWDKPAAAAAADVRRLARWHSTLVSADRLADCHSDGAAGVHHRPLLGGALVRPPGGDHAEATNIRWVMAGPRAMVVSPTTRVRVPSGALAWMRAVVPGVRPWSPR